MHGTAKSYCIFIIYSEGNNVLGCSRDNRLGEEDIRFDGVAGGSVGNELFVAAGVEGDVNVLEVDSGIVGSVTRVAFSDGAVGRGGTRWGIVKVGSNGSAAPSGRGGNSCFDREGE